jgi:hypothetical protein
MARKKTQPSRTESEKEVLDTLGTTGKQPTGQSDVAQAKAPADSQVADQPAEVITDRQVGQPRPTPPTEPPEQNPSDQHALVPVSNTFDKAPVPISKERLHELEDRFRRKMKEAHEVAAEAIHLILTIRDERQYEADGYQTFDAYMDKEWGHTRQWVELMDKRLKFSRLMVEKLGVSPDEAPKRLTLYDATILRRLQDDPDVLIAAIKEAQDRYKATGKKSPKTLKEVVEKWDGFRKLDEKLQSKAPPEERPQPLTPEEFSLLAQLRRNKFNPRRLGLVDEAKEKAQTDNLPLVLALDQVCDEANSVPPDEELLLEARGEALKELVAPLILRVKLWQAGDRLKETSALKEAEQAEAALKTLKKELATTPEQQEQERQQQEEERRKQEEREAERHTQSQEAHEQWLREQDLWAFHEDDLSLPSDVDPRKWCEENSQEGLNSDVLVRTAVDCLADAVKRLSKMDEAEKPITIKAAKKAIYWADKLLGELGV